MTPPGALPDDHLSVVVFGPGYGESIGVRGPDGRWLVVDSLRDPGTGRNPALTLLDDARPELLVLTHPHEDHADGFAELVERQAGTSGRVGVVPVASAESDDPLRHPDAGAALRNGRTRLALSTIQARWDAEPSSRWPLRAGADATLGDVRIDVISPRASLVTQAGVDANRLSAAALLSWREARVLLGADLPSGEWQRVDTSVDLGSHHLLKVAHHGSARSQHRRLADQAATARTWIVTPWSKAGRHLPRLGHGEDLDRLLGQVERVELTSSPVSLRGVPAAPISRSALSALADRATFGGDDFVLEYDDQPRSSEAGWLAAVLSPDGELAELRRGDAAVSVGR